MNARIVIGANYGDEGKGTVVASYTKKTNNVLNILTNGGAQRGHSILTNDGNITFHHFGSGTYHGADTFYSKYFILNPIQFVNEYNSLIIKPKHIFRDIKCKWSTPYDIMANIIEEEQRNRHCSCYMGIWKTIKRYNELYNISLDDFVLHNKLTYLQDIKTYYEKILNIPSDWKSIWNSPNMITNFYNDCKFMVNNTVTCNLSDLNYDNLIFENGQGLLLCDTGKDTYDTTPSNTGIKYSLELISELPNIDNITASYVTRPYLTRHGDGYLFNENNKSFISTHIEEDRTNHYNDGQGKFRYGELNINELNNRIKQDLNNSNIKFELEVTHCDEMDRINEFKKIFNNVNTYDTPLV